MERLTRSTGRGTRERALKAENVRGLSDQCEEWTVKMLLGTVQGIGYVRVGGKGRDRIPSRREQKTGRTPCKKDCVAKTGQVSLSRNGKHGYGGLEKRRKLRKTVKKRWQQQEQEQQQEQ